MKNTAAAVLLSFWLLNVGHGQIIIGPDGKKVSYTPKYCGQIELIQANLKLTEDTSVRGQLFDQSGAAVPNSPIELRRFIATTKQVTVKKSSTDGDGKFDLGIVKKGDYRLLLSPHRGFQQPENLECRSKDCTLHTVLILNPSDLPTAQCPIR
jgi:hypothetical protein